MTLDEAFVHLINSEAFLKACRTEAKLRVDKRRHEKGELKEIAKAALLTRFGYEVSITVKLPKKK